MTAVPDDLTLRHLAHIVDSSDDGIVSKDLKGSKVARGNTERSRLLAAAQEQASIVEKLTGRTRTAGGLGLGLSIVRHIVEMHGGSAHVASDGEGRGATFRVELPLMMVHREEIREPREHPRTEKLQPLTALDALTGVRVMAIKESRSRSILICVLPSQSQSHATVALQGDGALGQSPTWDSTSATAGNPVGARERRRRPRRLIESPRRSRHTRATRDRKARDQSAPRDRNRTRVA